MITVGAMRAELAHRSACSDTYHLRDRISSPLCHRHCDPLLSSRAACGSSWCGLHDSCTKILAYSHPVICIHLRFSVFQTSINTPPFLNPSSFDVTLLNRLTLLIELNTFKCFPVAPAATWIFYWNGWPVCGHCWEWVRPASRGAAAQRGRSGATAHHALCS